jgi:hypothetical protein
MAPRLYYSNLAAAVDPGVIDPVIGRPVMDGIAGARNDLAFAPNRADLVRRRARAQP